MRTDEAHQFAPLADRCPDIPGQPQAVRLFQGECDTPREGIAPRGIQILLAALAQKSVEQGMEFVGRLGLNLQGDEQVFAL